MAITSGDYLGIFTNGWFDSNLSITTKVDIFLLGWWEGNFDIYEDYYLNYPIYSFCNEISSSSANGSYLLYNAFDFCNETTSPNISSSTTMFGYSDMPIMNCR